MKRRIVLIVCICIMFILSGCTKAIDLTEEQNDIVAQYVADIMLNKDYYINYSNLDIIEEETTKEEETPPVEEPTSEDDTNPETPSTSDVTEPTQEETTAPEKTVFNLDKLYGLKDVEITYKSYKVVTEYPDEPDALFTLDLEEGHKFLVVEFDIKNKANVDIELSSADSRKVVKAYINEKDVNNYANILINNIPTLKKFPIDAGKTTTGVLIFSVEEKEADSIKSLNIHFNFNGQENKLIIK